MDKLSSLPSKQVVHTENAPSFDQSKFPFPQAISHGGMIFCSGNLGIDPTTKKLVQGTITDRTIQILKNLSEILKAGGSGLENAVKVCVRSTEQSWSRVVTNSIGRRSIFSSLQWTISPR